MGGGLRPAKAVRNRAIGNIMKQRQQAKRTTPQGPDKAQQANDYIQDYYREMQEARQRNIDWFENGTGDQTDSDVYAREWVQRQISGERGTSLTQAEIDAILKEAKKDDPRPH